MANQQNVIALRAQDGTVPDPGRDTRRSQRELPNRDADLSLRLFGSLSTYLKDRHGRDVLENVAQSAGLTAAQLESQSGWASLEQVEKILATVRSMVPNDDAFKEAYSYQYCQSFGLLRVLMGLVPPFVAYQKACEMFGIVSTISKLEFEPMGPNHARLRYTTTRAESRLLCLTRIASISAQPTVCGLPPAELRELSCVARGDASCTYDVRVLAHRRVFPRLVGLFLGIALGVLLSFAVESTWALWLAAPMAGVTLGYAYEVLRAHATKASMTLDIDEELRELAKQDADARREILDLHRRQREWIRLMEEQVNRTAALQQVVEQIEDVHHGMSTTIRAFSHELRNSLTVLRMVGEQLKTDADRFPEEAKTALHDHDWAVTQMERLLSGLSHTARSDDPIRLTPTSNRRS